MECNDSNKINKFKKKRLIKKLLEDLHNADY